MPKAPQNGIASNAVPAVVLFGTDSQGRPKAARFSDKHARLAAKAAAQLKLQLLEVTRPNVTSIAAQLPAGKIHANGRGLVPYVRREIYEKLLVAASDVADEPNKSDPATLGGSGANSAGPPPGDRPTGWDDIKVGHVVIAFESAEDGWFEAIVRKITGDMLTLSWREYPRERGVVRHRLAVGLLYPGKPLASAAKPKSGKEAAKSEAKAKAKPFPRSWEAISPGHLILCKDDGPMRSWWEAVVSSASDDTVTLTWRKVPELAPVVRPRTAVGLLFPNGH